MTLDLIKQLDLNQLWDAHDKMTERRIQFSTLKDSDTGGLHGRFRWHLITIHLDIMDEIIKRMSAGE